MTTFAGSIRPARRDDLVGADDPRIVGIDLRVLTEETDQRRFRLGHEGFRHRLVHIGVAGRCAPLPAPRHRAPNDLLGGVRDVGGLVDQRGILAAEFKQDRRQILGGRPRHDLSGAGAAGEENKVERKLEKLGDLFAMTCHCGDGVRLEILRHQSRAATRTSR